MSDSTTFTSITGEAVVPQPAAAGQLVGLALQDAAGTPLPAQVVSFGESFAPGQLAAGATVLATVGGVTELAQVDAHTYNADGSVALATVSLMAPALAAGQTAGVMLSAGAAPAAAPLDLSAASLGHTLTLSLAFTGAGASTATSLTVDLLALLRAQIANGTASFWEQGPLATQARIELPVAGSYHLVADITATADGQLTADVQFDNDVAEGATGGAATVSGASLSLDGSTTVVASNLVQFQYEDFDQVVSTGSASGINVQHDVAALERQGVVQNYDTSVGVDQYWMEGEATQEAAAGWNAPLNPDGIDQGMPGTGGRPDIGPTTQGNAAWLLTQNPTAAAYALGQARAAAGIPWHFSYEGGWLDTRYNGDIWTDGRGGPANYTAGLTQQVDGTNNGWTTDQSHQPDLNYDAYLLTGDRFYLDQLNAQASFSITEAWPTTRFTGDLTDNLINGEQVRAAAWNMREVDEAAWANPTGSTEGTYFAQVAADNWSWLVAQLPAWTAAEGQSYGWIPGNYAPGGMSPWQQDYFASTAIAAAEHGNTQAVAFLQWAANFEVGRFLNAAQGFNPANGAAYELFFETDGGTTVVSPTSWAQMQADTAANGGDNGTGWAHSQGDYPMLALQTLAGYVTVLDSPDALRAYAWLLTSGAPYIDLAALQDNSQFAIAPRLDDGNLLTRADITVLSDSGTAAYATSGADAMLIETGAGTVTLQGGAGTSVLVAGAGGGLLQGGSGADSLFGGAGAVTLSGGAGRNVLDVGTGAATILLSSTDAARDRVVGFRPGTDALSITMAGAPLTVSEAATLAASATLDAAGDAVLSLSPSHTVTLSGIGLSSLSTVLAANAVPDPATPAGGAGGTTPGATGTGSTGTGTSIIDTGITGTSTAGTGGTGGTGTNVAATSGAGTAGTVAGNAGTSVTGGAPATVTSAIGTSGTNPAANPPATTATTVGTTSTTATYVVAVNSTLATAPQGAATVQDTTAGHNLITSLGQDTITTGSGWDTVFAAGSTASVTGGTGHMVFVAGAGQYSVDGAAGSATLYGGSGSSTLRGGMAGSNVLVAGNGNATLMSGNGDLMFGGTGSTRFMGSGAGHDLMVGGTGQNSFAMTADDTAFGGGTLDVFDVSNGGAGAIIVGGAGQGQVLFGQGSTTAFAGTGADTFVVREGAAGTDGVVGFKATDHLVLQGYTQAQASEALASARTGGFGTALSLADGTTVTLWGVQALAAGQVSTA